MAPIVKTTKLQEENQSRYRIIGNFKLELEVIGANIRFCERPHGFVSHLRQCVIFIIRIITSEAMIAGMLALLLSR